MDFRHTPLLRRLIFSSVLRFLGMLVIIVAGLFLQPYMLDKLGANDCGLMAVVSMIISLMLFLEAGLNAAISRHVAAALGVNDEKLFLRYFNSGIFLFACIGTTIVLLAVLLSWNIESFIEASRWLVQRLDPALIPGSVADMDTKLRRNISLSQTLLILVALTLALNLISRPLVGVISGALREDVSSSLILGLRVARPVLNILVLFLGGGVIALNGASLGLVLFMLPIWYVVAKRIVPALRFRVSAVDGSVIKKLYTFSFFAFVAFMSTNLYSAAAVIVLTVMYGLETVAVYTMVCYTLFCMGNDVITILTNYLAPIFAQLGARKENETIRKTLFFAIKVSSGAAIFVAFGLIAWGHPFILRWMGKDKPEMLMAYTPLVLMALTFLLAQTQAPTVEYLYGTATHKYYALINSVEAAIAVTFFIPFAYLFQITGIALSLLLASGVARLVLQPFFVCKVLGIRRREYYARFALILFKGGVSVILPCCVTWLWVDSTFPRLFLVGGLSVLFFGPVYVLLVFSREERQLVYRALKPQS